MAISEEMIPTLTEAETPIKIRISGKDQPPETETMAEDLNPMNLSEAEITETQTLKGSPSQMKTNQLSSQ